jgi:hypothetical protein
MNNTNIVLTNLEDLYICNIVDKRKSGLSNHCIEQCQHGVFHEKDYCTSEEECDLHSSRERLKIKCRKIKKKEIKILKEKMYERR